MSKKLNVKYCILLPIVLLLTIFLWAVPSDFFGIPDLSATQQRVIALFAFADPVIMLFLGGLLAYKNFPIRKLL